MLFHIYNGGNHIVQCTLGRRLRWNLINVLQVAKGLSFKIEQIATLDGTVVVQVVVMNR